RPCDDPIDAGGAGQHLSSRFAPSVEALERNDLFVGRDLKHRVGGRIEDGPPGREMLAAKPRDDLGTRSGDVPQRLLARNLRERVNDLQGKAVRKSRKGLVRYDTGHLPMTGDR